MLVQDYTQERPQGEVQVTKFFACREDCGEVFRDSLQPNGFLERSTKEVLWSGFGSNFYLGHAKLKIRRIALQCLIEFFPNLSALFLLGLQAPQNCWHSSPIFRYLNPTVFFVCSRRFCGLRGEIKTLELAKPPMVSKPGFAVTKKIINCGVDLVARYSAILRYYSCYTPYSAIPFRGQLDVRYPPYFVLYASKCQCDRVLYGGYSAIGCDNLENKERYGIAIPYSAIWGGIAPVQTRVYPYPLGAGPARPNPKMGAPDPENPLFLGFSMLRGGLRPWSQTMVSEGARPWGRGRSGDFQNCGVERPHNPTNTITHTHAHTHTHTHTR